MLLAKCKISNSPHCQKLQIFNVSYIASSEIEKETYSILASIFEFAKSLPQNSAQFMSTRQRNKSVIIGNT
jgi:hypothetical protein